MTPSNVSRFVWYDLMTPDTEAAVTFYGKVIGWTAQDSGLTDRSYTIFSMGSSMIAGLMPIPQSAHGAQPAWMGYLGVDDVDAYAARIQSAGGAIHRGPEDIPGVGCFAVVADPQGAVFVLFRANGEAEMPPPGQPGRVGWHELCAPDLESAWGFYSGLFGWTKDMTIDMGPMGLYETFATGAEPVGGMMIKPAEAPMPFWEFYFNVDGVGAAVARIKEAGGVVLRGPHTVPGGIWIAQCVDPQGAHFSVTSKKR